MKWKQMGWKKGMLLSKWGKCWGEIRHPVPAHSIFQHNGQTVNQSKQNKTHELKISSCVKEIVSILVFKALKRKTGNTHQPLTKNHLCVVACLSVFLPVQLLVKVSSSTLNHVFKEPRVQPQQMSWYPQCGSLRKPRSAPVSTFCLQDTAYQAKVGLKGGGAENSSVQTEDNVKRCTNNDTLSILVSACTPSLTFRVAKKTESEDKISESSFFFLPWSIRRWMQDHCSKFFVRHCHFSLFFFKQASNSKSEGFLRHSSCIFSLDFWKC